MPKELLMMRHAKSSWESGIPTDHQRPLNQRGRTDAPVMAQWLVDRDAVPELVVSSDAKRTEETIERMLPIFSQNGFRPVIQFEESLYHAPANEWNDVMISLNDQLNRVMFLGHNPGVEQFVLDYFGDLQVMPTAAIACFEFRVDCWQNATPKNARLCDVWRVKDLYP